MSIGDATLVHKVVFAETLDRPGSVAVLSILCPAPARGCSGRWERTVPWAEGHPVPVVRFPEGFQVTVPGDGHLFLRASGSGER